MKTLGDVEELWAPVYFNEDYEVSNFGEVRRVFARAFRVKQKKDPQLGMVVQVGDRSKVRVAALVMRSFNPDKPTSHWVRFIDGDETNCSLENIEYCGRNERRRPKAKPSPDELLSW